MKYIKTSLIVFTLMFLASCGNSNPSITHIVVKSDSIGVLLDTDDSSTLKALGKIFYEKEEMPDEGPEFKFFVDITIDGATTRWQYSEDGFIRNFEIPHSMIYGLKDPAEFNRTANIR